MKRVITAFAGNAVFANILLILILLAGWVASQSMIRESMPEMALDIIRVPIAYPGADPEEIEEGISRKIEEALEGMEGIKQFTTYSSETTGRTIIEVLQGYDTNEVMDRIRSKVDAISSFPVDAERPIIDELSVHHQVMSLILSGDMSERRLKAWAEQIKEELLRQLCNGIQWQRSIEYMVDNGVSTFIEIGPGRVLSGLIKRISRDVNTVNIGDSQTVRDVVC